MLIIEKNGYKRDLQYVVERTIRHGSLMQLDVCFYKMVEL